MSVPVVLDGVGLGRTGGSQSRGLAKLSRSTDLEEHLGVAQLLGHVVRGGAGHLDPGLGEQGAGGEHEGDVEQGVDGVGCQVAQGGRGGDVVHQAPVRPHLPVVLLPPPQQLHQDVPSVPLVQQLAAPIPQHTGLSAQQLNL